MNASQVALLKATPGKWNAWIESHHDVVIDLSGADLRGLDLRCVELNGADLSHADLSGADLSYADLSHANLREADLRGTNLTEQEDEMPIHGSPWQDCR